MGYTAADTEWGISGNILDSSILENSRPFRVS